MKKRITLLLILAFIPVVVWAEAQLCAIDGQMNCGNVYPGAGPFITYWTCTANGRTHIVTNCTFTAINQPLKRWVDWEATEGSAGYTNSLVYCLADGATLLGGVICENCWDAPGSWIMPYTPTGAGDIADTNALPDGITCTTD
jgi:hypothetical protein